MSITTQSPANVAGTPELAIYHAPHAPLRFNPGPTTALLPNEVWTLINADVRDRIERALEQIEDAGAAISHGARFIGADDLAEAVARHSDARETLVELMPLHVAMGHGAPMSWFQSHRADVQRAFDFLRERHLDAANFQLVTLEMLLDSLIEI